MQRNNSQEEVYIGNAETLEVSAGPITSLGNATVAVSERNLPSNEPDVAQEAANEPIGPSNFDSLSHRLGFLSAYSGQGVRKSLIERRAHMRNALFTKSREIK